jgi:hypothetical protein
VRCIVEAKRTRQNSRGQNAHLHIDARDEDGPAGEGALRHFLLPCEWLRAAAKNNCLVEASR